MAVGDCSDCLQEATTLLPEIATLLKRLWHHISPRRRAQFGLLLVLMYARQSYADSQAEKPFTKKWEARRNELYKDLNLSQEQKKMLEENKNKHKEEMKALFNAMKEMRTSMRQELQKEKLDMAKIGEINNEMKRLEAQMSDQRLAGILEVRKILSPEQFKKFMEKMGGITRAGCSDQVSY